MLNKDIKINLKDDQKCICDCGYDKVKAADPTDAKLELTAACAEYVNAVAPGKRFDVKGLGNAVADFINDYLCLNPDNIPGCVQLAKSWKDIWNEFDKAYKDFKLDKCWHMYPLDTDFKDVPNDNKWHNTKHVDEPGRKIDEWVKKNIK